MQTQNVALFWRLKNKAIITCLHCSFLLVIYSVTCFKYWTLFDHIKISFLQTKSKHFIFVLLVHNGQWLKLMFFTNTENTNNHFFNTGFYLYQTANDYFINQMYHLYLKSWPTVSYISIFLKYISLHANKKSYLFSKVCFPVIGVYMILYVCIDSDQSYCYQFISWNTGGRFILWCNKILSSEWIVGYCTHQYIIILLHHMPLMARN